MLKPNDFGRVKKEDVIKAGYSIIDYGQTLTELGLKGWTWEQKLEHCIGFRCSSKIRGCVPVFDPFTLGTKGFLE